MNVLTISAYLLVGVAVAIALDAAHGGWRLWGTPYWNAVDFVRRAVGCAVFWPAVVMVILFDWALG